MISLEGAIRKHHTSYTKLEGILVFEMATGTGYQHGEPNRIDAFWMDDMPSKGLRRIAVECKTSRSDFLREIKNPLKRRAAMRVSNQFFFVAPSRDIIKPEEVPLDCGLMVLGDYDRLVTVVKAPFRDGLPASWAFFAAFARRLQKEAAAI